MASGMLKAFNTISAGNTQNTMLSNPPVTMVMPAMNRPSSKPSVNASHWNSPGGSRRQETSKIAPHKIAQEIDQEEFLQRLQHQPRWSGPRQPAGVETGNTRRPRHTPPWTAAPRRAASPRCAPPAAPAPAVRGQQPAQLLEPFPIEDFHGPAPRSPGGRSAFTVAIPVRRSSPPATTARCLHSRRTTCPRPAR